MYANIIVGVDGRQGGVDAAALAALLAAPAARCHLVFVAADARHPGRGTDADLHLELVDPDYLPELMGRERRLLGASRRHGIPHLGGDGVASVLHRTRETLAIAPVGYSSSTRKLHRIGVAFDWSSESVVALAHASLLAEERGCELVIRQVMDLEPAGHASPDVADGVEVEVVTGSARRRLVSLSRDVDLLVCGSRRLGPLRRLVLGSTSEYLARHVAVPLLITAPVDSTTVSRWRERQTSWSVPS